MLSSKGCTTAPVPIICQHTLGFLFCWETAVSLMAQCTDAYDINSASGGPGRLKHFVTSDDMGTEWRLMIRGIWIRWFGSDILPVRLFSPLQGLKVTLLHPWSCCCHWITASRKSDTGREIQVQMKVKGYDHCLCGICFPASFYIQCQAQ